jgi:Fic family protein
MDKALFSPASPGTLQDIRSPEPDWAFLPNDLPVKFALPEEHVPLLVDARQSLARLDGAGRYLPANTFLLRPLQRREALRSSALEGTFATAEELLAYGLQPKEPTSSTDPVNSWREVFNYDQALREGQESLTTLPLSSRLIRELHTTLLHGVRGTDRTPGIFRKRQVHIGSTRRFIPPPPERIEDLIANLERYMNEADGVDPLIRAFIAHYQFETIHPFLDGNGRVGRLLLSLMIYKTCDLQAPWLYLSPYLDQHKDEYIDRLFAVSTSGDWAGWIALCLRATIEVSRDALRRIDKLIKLKAKYEEQLARNPRSSARLQQIVVSLLNSPITTIPALAKQFDVSFPTASADVNKLVELKILTESDRNTKPKHYLSLEFFNAAYSEADE